MSRLIAHSRYSMYPRANGLRTALTSRAVSDRASGRAASGRAASSPGPCPRDASYRSARRPRAVYFHTFVLLQCEVRPLLQAVRDKVQLNCSAASQPFDLVIIWLPVEICLQPACGWGISLCKERGLRETMAGSVERAAPLICLMRSSANKTSQKLRSSKGAPDTSQALFQVSDASLTVR
jgi:hypothetical protein